MSCRAFRLEEFFKLHGTYHINGRGLVYAGQLLMNFGEKQLIGMRVIVNDMPMRVAGVEAHAIPNPYRRGALVGLMLEPL